jgi:hypothetical protein
MTSSPDPNTACRDVIAQWQFLSRLPEFATLRHGYCNSNNGTGVTYPDDLDEYDIEIEGTNIPQGWIQVFLFQDPILSGMGYEMLVPEHVYISALADALREANHWFQSVRMRRLATKAKVKFG